MAGILLNRSRQVPAEETPAFGGIAERFRRAGDLDRAIALCRDGLKRFPDQLSARVTLGWSLLDKGQYDEARAELEKVLRKAPDNLAAIRGLAELHDRSEGAMPAMDERESWRQEDGDAGDATRATTPAAEPVVAARATPQPSPETAVDPFAPIAVTLGSSTAEDSPKLLHTAEHAGLAAQEAAASADAPAELEQAVLPVQLEDPAAASMAAAESPTPFFVSSSEHDTPELVIEPAGSAPDAQAAIELEASVPTIDFGMAESSDAGVAFREDDVPLSLDWEAQPAAEAPVLVGLDAPVDVDAGAADELEDAIKALRDDTAIVLADLPVQEAVVEVESPGEPVVAFDTAESEFALDDALAALQFGDEPESSVHDAMSGTLAGESEPVAALDAVELYNADARLDVTELAPPTFDARDLDAPDVLDLHPGELPDAVFEQAEEERPPVGLIELPVREADDEAVAPVGEQAAFVADTLDAEEEAVAEGPVFELVAPDPDLLAAEEAVIEADEPSTAEHDGAIDLTPDLFSFVSETEAGLESELASMVDALDGDPVAAPEAVFQPEAAFEPAVEPAAESREPEPDAHGGWLEPESVAEAELVAPAAFEAEVPLEPEPALVVQSELAPLEADPAPEPALARIDEAVQESVSALFSMPAPALADVVVHIESRRPEPKPAVIALERLLRKVEARRLQLLNETVA